jgi:hypothetical protein
MWTMTFNVRVALWFPLLIAGVLGTFGVVGLVDHDSGDLFHLIWSVGAVVNSAVLLVFRNFPLVRITPDRVRSRTRMSSHSVPLQPTDRLAVWDDRLFVLHANGYSSEVPVYRILLRDADWQRFITEVERKWTPPHYAAR